MAFKSRNAVFVGKAFSAGIMTICVLAGFGPHQWALALMHFLGFAEVYFGARIFLLVLFSVAAVVLAALQRNDPAGDMVIPVGLGALAAALVLLALVWADGGVGRVSSFQHRPAAVAEIASES